MKETALILRFKGKDLRTAADIAAADAALMADLIAGEITATETLRILRELATRKKAISSGLTTAGQSMTLKEMAKKLKLAANAKRRPKK
ncbi:MAG TPA: hypothetical protein VK200_16165 [Candidatus Limnocylindrales bacterium]|nr:hypothetical protein [Candidatus Limnocylindrales bacterium]